MIESRNKFVLSLSMKERLRLKGIDFLLQHEEIIKLQSTGLPLRDRIRYYVLKGFLPDVIARFEYDKYIAVNRSEMDCDVDNFLLLVWRILDEL